MTLDDVDHLKIITPSGEEVTCYNPIKISKNGWCKVREGGNIMDSDSNMPISGPGQAEWGSCSSSCSAVKERSS